MNDVLTDAQTAMRLCPSNNTGALRLIVVMIGRSRGDQ
jgi:hypothetical protein